MFSWDFPQDFFRSHVDPALFAKLVGFHGPENGLQVSRANGPPLFVNLLNRKVPWRIWDPNQIMGKTFHCWSCKYFCWCFSSEIWPTCTFFNWMYAYFQYPDASSDASFEILRPKHWLLGFLYSNMYTMYVSSYPNNQLVAQRSTPPPDNLRPPNGFHVSGMSIGLAFLGNKGWHFLATQKCWAIYYESLTILEGIPLPNHHLGWLRRVGRYKFHIFFWGPYHI